MLAGPVYDGGAEQAPTAKGACRMATATVSTAKRRDWRVIVFTIVAGIVALLFLTNLYRLTAPWASLAWYPNDDPRLLNPELHRWHDAMWGAVSGILNGGVLVSLLWRPRDKPLLIQFMALVVVAAVLTMLPFEPTLIVIILVVASVIVATPPTSANGTSSITNNACLTLPKLPNSNPAISSNTSGTMIRSRSVARYWRSA